MGERMYRSTFSWVSGQLHAPVALRRERRLVGPQGRSERRGEVKILDPTGTRTPTSRSSSPLPVTIPTALSIKTQKVFKFNFESSLVLKISVFLYVSRYTLVDRYQRFGWSYGFYLRGRRVYHVCKHLYKYRETENQEGIFETTLANLPAEISAFYFIQRVYPRTMWKHKHTAAVPHSKRTGPRSSV
jgi:hypothetical protein